MPVDKIMQMKNEGFKPSEIAAKLNEGIEEGEEKITHQRVSKIIKDNTTEPIEVDEVIPKPSGILTMTAENYEDYSLANGRTRYGGEKGVKVNATIEELRAYINSGWRPSMLLEKWQMSEEELKQLTWALARKELRDKQPTINYKQDFFRF